MRWTLAAALFLAATSGCMKVREELLVLPDGSGRMTLSFTIPANGEAAKFTETELSSGDPDEIQDKVRGLVAMTRPRMEKNDGAVVIRMTAYFEDINAVKFMDDGEGAKAKPKQEFSFHRDGESFTVEVRGNLLADDGPEPKANAPELQKLREEINRAMYTGFELRQEVRLPGPITAIDGFASKDGRVAGYSVGEKELRTTA